MGNTLEVRETDGEGEGEKESHTVCTTLATSLMNSLDISHPLVLAMLMSELVSFTQ